MFLDLGWWGLCGPRSTSPTWQSSRPGLQVLDFVAKVEMNRFLRLPFWQQRESISAGRIHFRMECVPLRTLRGVNFPG
jgi:hypothetical protein